MKIRRRVRVAIEIGAAAFLIATAYKMAKSKTSQKSQAL